MAISPPRSTPKNHADSGHRRAPLSSVPQDPPSGIGLKAAPFLDPAPDGSPVVRRSLWQRFLRVFSLGRATDTLHLSVFGPPTVVPGETVKITINVHRPECAEGVRTLARAFQHDAELLGTCDITEVVARDTELAVHLSIACAGVGKSLQTFRWRGQPRRIVYEVYIPWEAQAGSAVGYVAIGLNRVLIGKAEINLNVAPRRG